jgi:hypothetical protein
VGRRDRPRIGALCPFVRLVSGVGDHSIGDRPRPDPGWETARFSVTPAPTAVLGAVWLSDRNGTILVAKERPSPPLYPSRLKNVRVLCHIPSVVRRPKATYR